MVIGYFGCVHKMHDLLLKQSKNFNILTFTDFSGKSKQQVYSFKQRIELLKKYNLFLEISKKIIGKEKIYKKLEKKYIEIGNII